MLLELVFSLISGKLTRFLFLDTEDKIQKGEIKFKEIGWLLQFKMEVRLFVLLLIFAYKVVGSLEPGRSYNLCTVKKVVLN